MIKIDYDVTYPFPASTVFAAVTDFSAYPDWQPDVVQAKGDTTVCLGTQVFQIRKVMGRETEVTLNVVEYGQDRLLTLQTVEGSRPGVRQSYRIEAAADGECRLDFQLELDGVPKMAEHLVRTQLSRQVQRIFESLGELIGRRAAEGSR